MVADIYDESRDFVLTGDDARVMHHLARAMRRVEKLVKKREDSEWESGVSVTEALGLVASELEAMYLDLDPEPVVFLRDVGGNRAGDRAAYGALEFFGPEYVEFRPRMYVGTNSTETDYAEWWAHRG